GRAQRLSPGLRRGRVPGLPDPVLPDRPGARDGGAGSGRPRGGRPARRPGGRGPDRRALQRRRRPGRPGDDDQRSPAGARHAARCPRPARRVRVGPRRSGRPVAAAVRARVRRCRERRRHPGTASGAGRAAAGHGHTVRHAVEAAVLGGAAGVEGRGDRDRARLRRRTAARCAAARRPGCLSRGPPGRTPGRPPPPGPAAMTAAGVHRSAPQAAPAPARSPALGWLRLAYLYLISRRAPAALALLAALGALLWAALHWRWGLARGPPANPGVPLAIGPRAPPGRPGT